MASLSQSTVSRCHHKAKMGLLSRIGLVILHQDMLPLSSLHRVATKPAVAAIVEMAGWLESKGVENTVGFNKGGTINVDGSRFR
ncbi:MAG TPA: hypothetical protein VF844_16870 [Ktedonobacteraceae bacterium]